MIEKLFLNVVEITLSTSWVILPLVLFSSLLKKKYMAKWSYLVWLIITLRLILPINFTLPQSTLSITIPDNFSPIITETYRNTKDNLSKNYHLNNILSKEPSDKINLDNPYNITSVFAKDNPKNKNTYDLSQLLSLKNISLIWLLGVLIFLGYHLIGYFIFRKSVKRWSWPVTDINILTKLQGITKELGLTTPLSTFSCRLVKSPMVIGLIKPMLLLPETYSYLNNLSLVLKHELIHYKRKDIGYKILLTFANAIHWFNPLVYFMVMEANKDLEFYCDEAVIDNMDISYRYEYSNAILSIMGSKANPNTMMSTNFNGSVHTMKKRFKNILNLKPKASGAGSLPLILTVVLTSSSLVACDNMNSLTNIDELTSQAIGYLKDDLEVNIDYNQKISTTYYTDDDRKIEIKDGYGVPIYYNGYTLELTDINITNATLSEKNYLSFDYKAKAILVYSDGTIEKQRVKGDYSIVHEDENGRGSTMGMEPGWVLTPKKTSISSFPENMLPNFNIDSQEISIVDEYTSSQKLCTAYMKALINKDFVFIGLNTAHILTTIHIEDGETLMNTIDINSIKIKDSKEALSTDPSKISKAYYELELKIENPGHSSLKKGKNTIWLYMCAKNNEGINQWIVQEISKEGPPSEQWWNAPVNFQGGFLKQC